MKPHSGPWVQPHPPKKEKPVIALNIWSYMHLPRPSILHPPAQLEATAAHGSIAAGQQPGPRRCKPARLPTPIRSSSFFSSVLLSCLTPSAPPALWLLGSSPPRVFAQLKRRDARPREDPQIAATPRRQSNDNL